MLRIGVTSMRLSNSLRVRMHYIIQLGDNLANYIRTDSGQY